MNIRILLVVFSFLPVLVLRASEMDFVVPVPGPDGELTISHLVGYPLRVVGDLEGPEEHDIIWLKNGRELTDQSGPFLEFSSLSFEDTGEYQQLVGSLLGSPIKVTVYPLPAPVNISSRFLVGEDADSSAILGFVIQGETSRSVLVRAITTPLAEFNISNVATLEYVKVFDSQGMETNELLQGFVNEEQKAKFESLEQYLGAFPSSENDYRLTTNLARGSYTVVTRAADAGGGVVLLEVYFLDSQAPQP